MFVAVGEEGEGRVALYDTRKCFGSNETISDKQVMRVSSILSLWLPLV